MRAISDLLDVNVWLAFCAEGHPHHAAALRAWGELHRPSFCRITHLGLMRLLCNRQVMGSQVFEPETAWEECEKLLAKGVVGFVDEPACLKANLGALTLGARAARDFWTDAYLAAFAQSAGMRLVTFDAGFTRFRGLACLILHPQTSLPKAYSS